MLLGVERFEVGPFVDGGLTNEFERFITSHLRSPMLEQRQSGAVVTFDHTIVLIGRLSKMANNEIRLWLIGYRTCPSDSGIVLS